MPDGSTSTVTALHGYRSWFAPQTTRSASMTAGKPPRNAGALNVTSATPPRWTPGHTPTEPAGLGAREPEEKL